MRHLLQTPVLSLLLICSLLGLASLAPAPAAAQRADEEIHETYESPQYGYTLTYEVDVWEITEEDSDPDDPYDKVAFGNGTSGVRLTFDPDYDEDELPTCLDDYTRGLEDLDGFSNVDPVAGRDADGDEDDRAWATYSYTFTNEDDEETDWVRYVACLVLGDGVTLVVTHDAPADDYEDEIDAREELIAGVQPAGEGGGSPDEGSYESPNSGFIITYDPEVWDITRVDENEELGDLFELTNGPSTIGLIGDPDEDEDELTDCVDSYVGGLEATDGVSDVERVRGRDAAGEEDDRAWATYSYTFTNDDGDDFDWIRYVECRWLGDGFTLVIQHTAAPDDFEDEIPAREDLLDGFQAPDDNRRETEEAVYESPRYGYTLTYDPNAWDYIADPNEDDPYDLAELNNGVSDVTFTGDPDYTAAEADDCVEDYIALLEQVDGVDALEPLDGTDAAGEQDDRAWATYSYVFDNGADEIDKVMYIECRAFGDDLTLVIRHTADADDYEDEIASREELLDGFQGPDNRPNRGDDVDGGDDPEAAVYESPNAGYALTYDPEVWEITTEDADEEMGDLVILTNGTSTVTLVGDPAYDEDELPDCIDSYVATLEQFDGVEDLEPLDDRDAAGEDDDRAWATFSYSFTTDDGAQADWIRYFECRVLPDGITLVVAQDAPPDDYDAEAEAREDLLEGLDQP